MSAQAFTVKKWCILFSCASSVHAAAEIFWIAQSPSNNMQDAANWSPNTIPGNTDIAVFDSTVTDVAFNPTENSAPFSVLSCNFPHLAAPFTCTFNNQSLSFSGVGITGAHTDLTLSLVNNNNTTSLGDMLSWSGAGTTGSADVMCVNSASVAGAQSGQSVGAIDAQVHSVGALTIADGGTITARTSGVDSTTASGGNSIAIGTTSQLRCDNTCTGGNNVTITLENSGTCNGSTSGSGDGVGVTQGYQWVVQDAFAVGDNFSCTVENNGTNSSTGAGNNQVGVLFAAQVGLQATAVVGDNGVIAITNTGISTGATSNAPGLAGYINDNQLYVGHTLQAGDGFQLTVSNIGDDTSTGVGQGQVASINSNSGASGDQVLLLQGGELQSDANITVRNSGTYTGSNTAGGCQVALMNLGQCTIGDVTSVGSYHFSVQDDSSIMVANSGVDSASGVGGDAIGVVSSDQLSLFTPCALGDRAEITISNAGDYSGLASVAYVNVGSVGANQFNAASALQAGDDFTLLITNSGYNTGRGTGDFFVGDIINGQQANFQQRLTVGDNGSIEITNTGSNASSTTNHNQVGSFMGYGVQLLVHEGLQAGDNLQVTVANRGFDNSTVSGGNYVGFINNNSADGAASQVHLANGGSVGNNASMTISNAGTFSGNNAGGNGIALLAGPQFSSVTAFQAGDQLSLDVSMMGEQYTSGQSNNSVATSNGSQVSFGSDCTVGNGATFTIFNGGINQDTSGTNNAIGRVGADQMNVSGDFRAGTDLTINISNRATNSGDDSNNVGYVAQSQLAFGQACTVQDGAVITVANEGTVGASQILFAQGFTIPSGVATIQAINQGTVTDYGIEIQGNNAGGNANIELGNSSVYIATSLPDFTIAGLIGDPTSIAQSQPTLIINRRSADQATFAGSIQDFSDIVPTVLVKSGTGTQILAGTNSYTGLTTVQEGTLIVNGSLAGDMVVESAGTVKGSGIINGTLTNMGTIAPGQSIGTVTVGTYDNNGGTYQVEVNGAGQSDLINVLGAATLSEGTVQVIPEDFNFISARTYTIITAGAGVTGTFTSLTSTVPALMKLVYNPYDVQLVYMPLAGIGLSCNALNAATCFTTLASADATAVSSTLQGLDVICLESAFSQMSPALFSSPTEVQLLDAILVRTMYTKHIQRMGLNRQQPCTHGISVWLDGIARGQSDTTSFGYTDITVGATMGIDYTAPEWILGAAFSSTYDMFRWQCNQGSARLNSYYGGLYGRWNHDQFYLDVAVIGASNNYNTTRRLEFSTIERYAHAHHTGAQGLIHTRLAYETDSCGCQVTPYLNLDYVVQHERCFTESGADSLDLQVKSQNAMLFQGEAGVALSSSYDTTHGQYIPMLSLAYMNQTPCTSPTYRAAFVDSTCCFSGRGGYYERNLFVPRVAFTYQSSCRHVEVSLYYDAQVGNQYWAQDGVLELAFRF